MSLIDVSAAATYHDFFSLWNAKLLNTFFSNACHGDEVWLQLDGDELDLIGPELGGEEGFLRAVRAGPAWPTLVRSGKWSRGESFDLVPRTLGLVNQRLYPAKKPRDYVDPGLVSPAYRDCRAPAYLPYLAALVRSSAMAKDGYYKHLQESLFLPPGWNSQHLSQLEVAWDDLQDWTKSMKGRFGRFVFRRLGGYAHVGVPRSQCIMSRQDCDASSRVFTMAGLRQGQHWSAEVVNEVLSYAAEELSASFKDALKYNELRDPLLASLRSLFDEWDGSGTTSSHLTTAKKDIETASYGDVEVAFSLPDDASRWQMHWRVMPGREGSDVVLEREGSCWRAPVWGTEQCSTVIDATTLAADAAQLALVESATRDVFFNVHLEEDGSEAAPPRKIKLPRCALRVFVWGVDYASQREELHEHPLPQHGYAYLLATHRIARDLLCWLERGEIEHEIVRIDGLPMGWVLACVSDCNKLTDKQVEALPGIVAAPRLHRTLAIVGGRSISRASRRQYLSYDLPSIELDAPKDTTLRADAVLLEEISGSSVPDRKTGIRRFRISLPDNGQKSFNITAVHGKRELANVTLRIAPDNGEQVAVGREFSLDSSGNPQEIAIGLRGILKNERASGTPSPVDVFSVGVKSLGILVDEISNIALVSNPSALFLDSLSRHGSMAYGTAKDQVARLLACGRFAVRPDLILLNLRCRGHIEIETNARGHFVRIHAVSPALYQLPIIADGYQTYTALGTFTIQQWRNLFDSAATAAYQLDPTAGQLPTWTIVSSDASVVNGLAHSCGIARFPMPSINIASWATSCDDVRALVESGAVESIGALEHHPQRLNASSGCFMENVHSLRPQSAFDLFRMDDRDIAGGRVYVLAMRRGNVSRYGFVRDSRWGVWIALRAFAQFVKDKYAIDDACPWPIPYAGKDGVVMLPARISLPVVLERALVLCSGRAPEVVDAFGRTENGQCVIVSKSSGKSIAVVSNVYSEMASGKWLCYRSVPLQVATLVANKLGAILTAT